MRSSRRWEQAEWAKCIAPAMPRATGPSGNTEISVTPDGSPVFTRDIGTQEIYSLTVKWP